MAVSVTWLPPPSSVPSGTPQPGTASATALSSTSSTVQAMAPPWRLSSVAMRPLGLGLLAAFASALAFFSVLDVAVALVPAPVGFLVSLLMEPPHAAARGRPSSF